MANEATNVELPRVIKRYPCSDNVAIALGTICKLSASNLVAPSAGADVFAGIAVEEKVAGDGITEIALAQDGKWSMTQTAAGTGITFGKMVALSGANLIRLAVEADFPLGAVIGKLETSTTTSSAGVVNVGSW